MPFLQKNIKIIAVIVILLLSVLFFWPVVFYTRGNLSMPLDDSFIYFQFAKNIVSGGIMEWSPGDGFSSAATSPLYPFVLAIGYTLGFKGDWIILWALMIGTGCLVASFFILAALSRRLMPGKAHRLFAFLAPAFFILSGSQIWGYLSGMEIGLFSTSLLATLHYAFQYLEKESKGGGRTKWKLGLWGALLGILRPEGFFLVLMLAVLLIYRGIVKEGKKSVPANLAWLLMAAPPLVWLAVIYAKLGQHVPSAMLQKSFLYDPVITPYLLFKFTFINVKKVMDNVYLRGQSPPFFVIFFFIGLMPPLIDEIKKREPGKYILMALWFFMGSLSTMVSMSSDDHHFRYQMPFVNLYLLGGSLGIIALLESTSEKLKIAAASIVMILVFVQVLNLPRWIDAYGMNSKNIYEQQTTIGKFIEKNLPKDAVIGLNDAGSIPYYSERRCYDILGLGSDGQSRWYRQGSGSLFESFENLKKEDRPDFFALYPRWWFNADILKEKIFDVNLTDNTICGDAYKALYRADWTVLGTGHCPAEDHGQTLKIADRVDVADLLSEDMHDYKGPPETLYAAQAYKKEDGGEEKVADGGRKILCMKAKERMHANIAGKKDTKIVARLENNSYPLKLAVRVNDRVAGQWQLIPSKGWIEPEVHVPGEFFKKGDNVITIECYGDGQYRSFHYWFLQ